MTLPVPPPQPLARGSSSASSSSPPGTHRIRLVPHLDSRRTLRFDAISRDLKHGDPPLRIGRFTDRSGIGLAAANALSSNKLAFKSKVVSRAHAEIWVESAKFYIKDTKSSSGTFLNHLRLSPAGTESKPHQLKDGDILQLGVDYQGGTEDIYKSVKIRIEVGREWQAAANAFNTNAISQLKSLAAGAASNDVTAAPSGKKRMPKTNIPDCCICLFSVTIRQALFIAPCSHAFHYKCIRPLLEAHDSAFSCPLCRTFANLEEDVEVEADHDDQEDDDDASEEHLPTSASALITPPSQSQSQPSQSQQPAALPTSTSSRSGKHLAVPNNTRDRDREAGAETEVETDAVGGSSGAAGRTAPRRPRAIVLRTDQTLMGPVVDISEPGDFDEEMLDVARSDHDMDADVDGENDHDNENDGSLSPGYVSRGAGFGLPIAPSSGMVGSGGREDMSEGEGSGSGGGSNEEVMDGGVEGDTAINGKRKR